MCWEWVCRHRTWEAHRGVKGGGKHMPEGPMHSWRGVQRTQKGELESKKKWEQLLREQKLFRDGDMMGGGRKEKTDVPRYFEKHSFSNAFFIEGISDRDGNMRKGMRETHFKVHRVWMNKIWLILPWNEVLLEGEREGTDRWPYFRAYETTGHLVIHLITSLVYLIV